MCGLLVYPARHIIRAILQSTLQSAQTPIALILVATLVGLFSWWILRPVRIEMEATSKVPIYGEGSVISGIQWRKEYAELDLKVRNASEDDYSNLDIEITTDLMFQDLRPRAGLASCIIARSGEPFEVTSQRMEGVKPVVNEKGALTTEGGVPVGPVDTTRDHYKVVAIDKNGQILSLSGKTNRTYRIRCERFPANSQNNFVAALSVVNPFVAGKPPKEIYGAPRPATEFSAKVKLVTGILKRSRVIASCKMGETCKG